MKALVLKEYKRLAFEDVAAPKPASGEVLVGVKACGICGSDVHGMDGSSGRRRPPIIMGHEASGVISAVGAGVNKWAAGDRVTFDSTIYCGQCDYCRRGEINLCDRRRVLGVSCEEYRQHGAFAEFVAVPQHLLYHLPEGLPFEHAALAEPFSIALHAINRLQISKTNTVVVIGAGMIGLALIQGLRHAGCAQIIVVDVAADRLALAEKCGATTTIDSTQQPALEVIRELTQRNGVACAFEAVGITPTVDLAVRCVRKGGQVVLVGNISPSIELPLQVAVTRELTILGSCASRGEYPACLELLAERALNAEPLISVVAPLAEGVDWFERLYRKEPGLVKVILKP